MKGGVNVLGHAGGISADVEAGAVFQPFPELFAFLDHEMLNVYLLLLVAGPGYGQFQSAVRRQFGQLVFIAEIGSFVWVAEEQPIAALVPGGDAFLPE